VHEGGEARRGLCRPLRREVAGAHGGGEWGVPQGARAETGLHSGFEERGA